ncbi:MAG: lipid A biosynthesis acyltransferase [Blastocatellia bacterium]
MVAKKGKLQIYAEYLIARLLLSGLGLLPRSAAVTIGRAAGRLAYHVLGRLRRTGMINLRLAFPEKSDAERQKILTASFENLGRTLGEVSQFPYLVPAKLERIVDFTLDEQSMELYRRVKNEKQGVLIVTGHLGNWEMLVFAFAALYEPMAYLARPLDNPLLEDFTARLRSRFGNRPLNKSGSAMTAVRLLREGEILGVLADINAHPKEGVFVDFFGIPACTSAGPAIMALRSRAIILPAFCVYDNSAGRYRLVRGNLIEYAPTGDRVQDLHELTRLYTAEIEKIIRAFPEQWLWIHKRWKTRPKGEQQLY